MQAGQKGSCMTKQEISSILAGASREQVQRISRRIQENHRIEIVKEPKKTLVMVKVRESIQKSLFYLGEVLACECMVQVDEARGFSVQAGDDFEKVLASAVIDGALNGDCVESGWIEGELRLMKEEQERRRGRLNAQILKSKVNFNVMGE